MLGGQFEILRAAGDQTAVSSLPTGSDVGSLFPFIQSQAVKGEFPLSFLNPRFRSLQSWKKTARGKLLELLHYAPAACDPAAETVERVDCGELRPREGLVQHHAGCSRAGVRVGAEGRARNPRLPSSRCTTTADSISGARKRLWRCQDEHPVLTEFRRQYYGGRSIAIELVRQGYMVVVIDMFYWGERRMLLDDDPADWRERPASLHARAHPGLQLARGPERATRRAHDLRAGFTWPGVMFWDDIRTVDYLLTRPDVDPRRIGCVGLSVGGLRSCHLAALDERIRAAVVVGWMASFPAQLKKHIRNTIGHTKVVPGLYRHLDYPDVASLAMPTPLLGHQWHEGRPVRSRWREGELRQAERLLRQGRRARPLPHAALRNPA